MSQALSLFEQLASLQRNPDPHAPHHTRLCQIVIKLRSYCPGHQNAMDHFTIPLIDNHIGENSLLGMLCLQLHGFLPCATMASPTGNCVVLPIPWIHEGFVPKSFQLLQPPSFMCMVLCYGRQSGSLFEP